MRNPPIIIERQRIPSRLPAAPLYPLFLAANYLIFGQQFITVRLVQAVLGAYCSVLIFLLGSSLLGERVGKIAAIISIFYPYYIFLSGYYTHADHHFFSDQCGLFVGSGENREDPRYISYWPHSL